ncbi:MAG: ATP-binding cassette domain-containing protein, partial [Eubacteriales bacterium]|nr:ATP-binding cassette domain-containing protein [Eubacteriales bacterium]
GICLTFEPGEGFEPGGRRKKTLLRLADGRDMIIPALGAAGLCTAMLAFVTVMKTGLDRAFMDRVLTGTNPQWLRAILLLALLAAALQAALAAVRKTHIKRLQSRLAVSGSLRFLWKVLHMPVEFFTQRMAGDIQSRLKANAKVARQLTGVIAPLAMDCLMMLFYLIVMLRYSAVLTLVGVTAIAVNTGLSFVMSRRRENFVRVQMRSRAQLSAMTVSGIGMMDTIKAAGAENGFFEKWALLQAQAQGHATAFERENRGLVVLARAVSLLANTAVLMLGARFAMQGSFTPGMIMAFQGLLSAFSDPASRLIPAGQTLLEMRTSMEKIEDVMQYPEDPCFACAQAEGEQADYAKLRGHIELKNVTFGYSRLGKPVIRDFSMNVEPGACVAIVGASGCGKSTVSRLISGLHRPWSGEILFDGKPMEEIDRAVLVGSLAVVDQDIVLFEDSIAGNIKLWDESIEDFEMILAARDAGMHEDIMKRSGGYRARVEEGGRNFSGGQRQRLEIARVLAQDPTMIILDEATSALDAQTEHEVIQAIRMRGVTCIVIAHRLSAIRDCDEIIVLDRGEVAERGTHEALAAMGGRYAALVTHE